MSRIYALFLGEAVTTTNADQPPAAPATTPKLRRVLAGESFVEKLALLLAAAAVSGVVVPFVFSSIERTRARSDAIATAQQQLLNDVTDTLMTYEALALDVSYFRTSYVGNDTLHEAAFQRYNDRFVELLAKWRTHNVRARFLSSEAMATMLDDFLTKVFREQDLPMNQLHGATVPAADWEAQHQRSVRMLTEAGLVIDALAKELRLTRADVDRRWWRFWPE
jgi:hypothetical protein